MIPLSIKTDLTSPATIKPVTSAIPVSAILDSQQHTEEYIEGQKYQAIVESRLLNGYSRVLIAGTSFQMKLPENLQPGNKLELVFIAHKPEPQFLISNQLSGDKTENKTSISPTGHFLGALMQDIIKNVSAQTHGNSINNSITPAFNQPLLLSSEPISLHTSTNNTELPSLLQKAITQSGLFYESHQAQWIQGENSIENLRQEPQGRLMLITTDSSPSKALAPASQASEIPIHHQAIPLVQQQLSTLETGHIFWNGEIWPGQFMSWNIHEESQRDEHKNISSEQAAQWHTQIRLSMPQLGDITATIVLNTQGIDIKIDTTQVETANFLKNNQLTLATNMQFAGITIQILSIQHDDN